MLVTLLIGLAVVGAGQLLRGALARAAKALLEAEDMEQTLEDQANNAALSPSPAFSGSIRNLPGNLWHLSRSSVREKGWSTCLMQQVGRPISPIGSVSVRASYSRPRTK
jgi:hypothetical protein